jgi:hypothetical protein
MNIAKERSKQITITLLSGMLGTLLFFMMAANPIEQFEVV